MYLRVISLECIMYIFLYVKTTFSKYPNLISYQPGTHFLLACLWNINFISFQFPPTISTTLKRIFQKKQGQTKNLFAEITYLNIYFQVFSITCLYLFIIGILGATFNIGILVLYFNNKKVIVKLYFNALSYLSLRPWGRWDFIYRYLP